MNELTAGEGVSRTARVTLGAHQAKMVTMAEVARAANVSQGAISSLLNDRDYGIRVSDKTRERVFKACRDLGYIPNDLRAVVRMYPETGDLCVLIPQEMGDLSHPLAVRVTAAAMRAVSDRCGHVSISRFDAADDFSKHPERLPHPVRAGTASKFILLGEPNSSLLAALQRRECPVAALGLEVRQPGVTSYVTDYQQASGLAIELLAGLGHKQIAILSGPFGATDPSTLALNRGIRLTAEKVGMILDEQSVLHGDLTSDRGARSLDSILERGGPQTAVFCLSDQVAAGVLGRARERGVKVPEEMSVLGCSDEPFAALLSPALTTVHIPIEAMTEAAVRELESRVFDVEPSEAAEVKVFAARMVERGSCQNAR